jgi:molybdopterin biosynthesis enzyme
MSEFIAIIDNKELGETRENRTRAQILLDKIKCENKRKKFVRVPIERGWKEVEVGKYERMKKREK